MDQLGRQTIVKIEWYAAAGIPVNRVKCERLFVGTIRPAFGTQILVSGWRATSPDESRGRLAGSRASIAASDQRRNRSKYGHWQCQSDTQPLE